jgi:hypothetical protein
VLGLRGGSIEGPFAEGSPASGDLAAGTGLVMTAAQAAGFFARSSSWRCTGCGKVHVFAHVVPVVAASPCACASIEFEPRLEADFSWGSGQRQIRLMT